MTDKKFNNIAKMYNKDLDNISDFKRLKAMLNKNPDFDVSKLENKFSKMKLKE